MCVCCVKLSSNGRAMPACVSPQHVRREWYVHARNRRETPRQTLDTPLQPSPAIRSQPSSYFVPDMKISSMSPLSFVVRALSCCWRSAAALLEKTQSFCRRVCVCVCMCVFVCLSLSLSLRLSLSVPRPRVSARCQLATRRASKKQK